MVAEQNHVQPALDAIAELRADIKKRIGKEGGNLNQLQLSRLRTIEGILLQIPPIYSTLNAIHQQTQLATHMFRNISQTVPQLRGGDDADNGDNGVSETKGE